MVDMRKQIDDHLRAVAWLLGQVTLLESIAARITDVLRRGGKVCLLGNGGSAADAQHIAAELLGRFKRDRRALPAIALTTDSSSITAIGNDLGGNQIFRRQVEALAVEGDVVWALSVSGRSPNVLSALEAAREQGAVVSGFTSRDGGPMAEYCDLCLKVEAAGSDRVQEVHELAYHLICDRVEEAFAAGS